MKTKWKFDLASLDSKVLMRNFKLVNLISAGITAAEREEIAIYHKLLAFPSTSAVLSEKVNVLDAQARRAEDIYTLR